MGRSRRQPRRPRLSLCLIARDEAAFLERCLVSVRGLVDELVVVDTGSMDETPAVARRHGARVFPFIWQDDFAAARNHGLARVKGEWVLVLDCDELLSPRDHQAVRQALATREFGAYRLTTRNYTAQSNRAGWVPCAEDEPESTGQAGWFPSTKVRLWRRRSGVRFEGAVHELVEPSLLRIGARIGDCPVPVHHYGYAGKPRNPELYLRAGERKVRDNPADLRAWYELAIAYRDAGRLEEALAAGERVIAALDTTAEPAGLYLDQELARLVHADLLLRLGRLEETLAALDALLARHPDSAGALNNRGLVLEKLGRLAEARDSFARGARQAPENRVLAGNLARLTARGGHGPNGLPQQAPGPRLSVCVIARNEERVLGRCLESVRPVADELILVDTGSTDGTRAIAEGLGARLGHFPWCDDFAAARNASLDLATGDWILWLDADDYLLPADLERLRRLKQLAPEQAFYCTLVNEGSDRSAFRQVKIFPRRLGVRFERPVHETVAPSLERLGIPIRATDLEVRHTGYADPEVAARKRRYYLELMKGWLAGHPDDWYLGFRVGHTHYLAGEHRRAREEFAALLARAGGDPAAATAAGLALLFTGRSWLEEGQGEAALPFLERAAVLRPDDALTLLSLGDARTKLRRYGEAITSLRAAIHGRLDPFLPLDAAMVGYSARFFLGQALQALGERSEAEAVLAEAERLMPDRPEAREALAVLRGASSPAAAPATAPGPPRLSLCMIVRNEEARLARCLESARGAVDEIVVVDTGSTDRTVEIARGFGARLGHFPWCDDFAAARNASLNLATGDWILWLDADDLLPAEAHPRIRELIGQGRDRAYFFVLDDQGYENVSCLQLRLFPNLPGVRFEMPIHEQVTPSLARLGVRLVPTDLRVVHTGYATPEVVRAKKER
ncbi:MAG: glycosyltransferase, partial [Candidatus Latescibacterota bacterium]